MKSRTKQSLMKRVNNQGSFTTTCKPFDTGTSYQLHRTIGQHLSVVLLLLLSTGIGLDTATVQAQTPAYVTNNGSNTVSVIDTGNNTVVATIPVGFLPFGIAITPDGTRAYAANESSNTVSVIDTATNTVIATIPVGQTPFGVAITPDGTRAYVTNLNTNTVSVIDTATNIVIATIPVGLAPEGRLSGNHLVQDCAQTEDVGASIRLIGPAPVPVTCRRVFLAPCPVELQKSWTG
jgi:YVTN family beta-propeller protein